MIAANGLPNGRAAARTGKRPNPLAGLRARTATKLAPHNVCLWLNQRCGRRPGPMQT